MVYRPSSRSERLVCQRGLNMNFVLNEFDLRRFPFIGIEMKIHENKHLSDGSHGTPRFMRKGLCSSLRIPAVCDVRTSSDARSAAAI